MGKYMCVCIYGWNQQIIEIIISKRMRFKYSAAVITIIWSFFLAISHETCWLAPQHVPIS